jgi:hypothetical protein
VRQGRTWSRNYKSLSPPPSNRFKNLLFHIFKKITNFTILQILQFDMVVKLKLKTFLHIFKDFRLLIVATGHRTIQF